MPIVRTYACEDCFHQIEVTLSLEQVDQEAPECPACAARQMRQEFRAPAIIGSPRYQATKIAEEIAGSDYHVADMQGAKVRYKDQNSNTSQTSTWGVAQEALQSAVAAGRQVRLQHGSGLDVLQANLANGTEPDLIEISKRRSMKVW